MRFLHTVYLSKTYTSKLLVVGVALPHEIQNNFIQIIGTKEQDKTAVDIFISLQNIFSEVQTLNRHENVYLSKMST